jgi:chemotaxis methyl-accepting protein methylase
MATNPEADLQVPGSSIAAKLSKIYLREIERIWRHLPVSFQQNAAGIAFGRHIHRLVQEHANRKQFFGTFFLRNRAELRALCNLVKDRPTGAKVSIAVIACSKGAEVYSIVWALQGCRPDLDVRVFAIDISEEILEFASRGVYSLRSGDPDMNAGADANATGQEIAFHTIIDQNAPIFERVNSEELNALADVRGDVAYIKDSLKHGIRWIQGDALSEELPQQIGTQEIVVANKFLCHMSPEDAERCLKNVARLIKPGGHILVAGIDLEVRTKVAGQLQWKPVSEWTRELHDGDVSVRNGWPLQYWGLEPYGAVNQDPQLRYASIFCVPGKRSDADLVDAGFQGNNNDTICSEAH